MLQLVPFFFFVYFLCYVYGNIPFILLKKQLPLNPFTPVLIGYAVLGLLSQWFMVGGAINGQAIFVSMLGAVVALWRYKPIYLLHFREMKNGIKAIHISLPFLMGLLIIILYQSALPTKINDMGAYYLQTLQWMRQYGMVKGLGNLHPALGLGSAWHSLSVLFGDGQFDLFHSMGTPFRFFAINGTLTFAFLLFVVWEIRFSWSAYLVAFGAGIMALAFLYLTAPSPDFPILIYTGLLFYFIFIKPDALSFPILLLLACFGFACKPSAFLLIFSIVFAFFKYLVALYKQKSLITAKLKMLFTLAFLATLFLSPVIIKNFIQTGYVLYPSSYEVPIKLPLDSRLEKADGSPIWQIPRDWNAAYRKGIQTFGLNDKMDSSIFKDPIPGGVTRFFVWFGRNGYKGFMNKIIAFNVLISIVLLAFGIARSNKLILLFLIFSQVLEWYFLSQYRLMLPGAISLLSYNFYLIVGLIKPNYLPGDTEILKVAPATIFLAYLVLAFFPLSAFREESRNKVITQTGGGTTAYLVKPYSAYGIWNVSEYQVDLIMFHTYSNQSYAWDCPIPAMSMSHRKFVEDVFHYRVHAIGTTPGEGFYLQKE